MDGHRPEQSESNPVDMTIAIVSHKHYPFLDDCLSSVFANTKKISFEVTLVDNVGEPEIEKLIKEKFPQVRLLVNDTVMGFSQNNNQVIMKSDARYSFLLNPDTEVQPGAIDSLVEFMDNNPEVGACGPKLIYPDGRLQLSCREFPTLGAVLVRRTPLRLLLKNSKRARSYTMADRDHTANSEIGWLFGAAIVIRRQTLQDVGGLDEDMFLYSEDVDWCLRCWQKGWKIYYVPDSVIVHHIDDDKYNGYFTRHRLLHYRSMARYVRKHWRSCLRW